MEVYTLVGIRDLDFTGSDGNKVSGYNLYFTFEHQDCDGVCTDKIFVSKKKFGQLSFVPQVGSECQIMYNRFGKVADIVKV